MLKDFIHIQALLFFLVLSSSLSGQNKPIWTPIADKAEAFVVDSIEIRGNFVTKDFVILRELSFAKGDTVSKKELAFNRERIFSLGIFNRVEFFPAKVKNPNTGKPFLNVVVILVEESWRIYPLPLFNIENNNWDKISYGVGLLWKNFRGRNETLSFTALFGYDPEFAVSYFNPMIFDLRTISLNTTVFYSKIENKSPKVAKEIGEVFSYEKYYLELGLGKRLNNYNLFYFAGGFQYIEQPFSTLEKFTASGGKIDRTPFLILRYTLDTRDLKQFSESGSYADLIFKHNGFGLKDVSYNLFTIDLRRYQPLENRLFSRWRLYASHDFGRRVPFYSRPLFGLKEIIRGHSFDWREGDNALKFSFELNYPLIREWNLRLNLPPLPEKLTSARIGVYLTSFFDSGVTFDNGEKLTRKKFDSGFGFGMEILILPYNAVRLEYAFNEKGEGEILVGTGFSF